MLSQMKSANNLASILTSELEKLGVKYKKEKRIKNNQKKYGNKKLFGISLHCLEFVDAISINGDIIRIPKLVSDACQRILENVNFEGLFRKAGSTSRQRVIRKSLEEGQPLGKNHHVIDIANILKTFFRELPEPLLPLCIQDILLQSLNCGDNNTKALLISCLLMPKPNIDTFAFFMQFLNTIAFYSDSNKMTAENLAIIFTPGLMSLTELSQIRFKNCVQILKTLILNAEMIGIFPPYLLQSLAENSNTSNTITVKKKRRSGSLTRMFTGIRKIVGAIGSSTENLDETLEENQATPCIVKTSKKRKQTEVYTFSAKKRRELLDLCPKKGELLPSTPLILRDPKKFRLSLGLSNSVKNIDNVSLLNESMKARWNSVVPIQQDITKDNKKTSNIISLISLEEKNSNTSNDIEINNVYISEQSSNNVGIHILKNEYEAIKDRVSAIETKISQEFDLLRNKNSEIDTNELSLTGPERVMNKFEKTLEETEYIASPSTDKLAKRLSRELKIRKSVEIIRSPSARKIGSVRRRHRVKNQLCRNNTWHVSSIARSNNCLDNIESFYSKTKLKRGQPNSVQSGLHLPIPIARNFSASDNSESKCIIQNSEKWISADLYFKELKSPQRYSLNNTGELEMQFHTPKRSYNNLSNCKNEASNLPKPNPDKNFKKTPMLPPNSIPRKIIKTPNSTKRSGNCLRSNVLCKTTTPVDDLTGRASIARLRSQNAGMVLAKAKLFDELGNDADIICKRKSLKENQCPKKLINCNNNKNFHNELSKNDKRTDRMLLIKGNTLNNSKNEGKTIKNISIRTSTTPCQPKNIHEKWPLNKHSPKFNMKT